MKRSGVTLSADKTAYICPRCAHPDSADEMEIEGYSIVTRVCDHCAELDGPRTPLKSVRVSQEKPHLRAITDEDISKMNAWLDKQK